MRPKIAGRHRIKFKAEAVPLKDHVGGYRLLYSHNGQFDLSQMQDADRLSMDTLPKALPALKALKTPSGEGLGLVHGGIVEEVLLPLGELDFGKGQLGKCDISLWPTRGEHLPRVGEFAFQAKFPSRASVAAQFYIALQQDVTDWLALGVTTTAMVCRLKGNAPQSHELALPMITPTYVIGIGEVLRGSLQHHDKLGALESGAVRVGEVLLGCPVGIASAGLLSKLWPLREASSAG